MVNHKCHLKVKDLELRIVFILVYLILFFPSPCKAQTSLSTVGNPRFESTIHKIGAEWDITGDSDHDATGTLQYRIIGTTTWSNAMPPFRIDSLGENMIAGSIFFLNGGTTYDVKMTVTDPDGGSDSYTRTVTTRSIPTVSPYGKTYHVEPGSGGGSGTEADPFQGISAAEAVAQPGDVFLLHAGTYGSDRVSFNAGGTAGNYVVWKAYGDGNVVFHGIRVMNTADYSWYEGFTISDTSSTTYSGRGVVVYGDDTIDPADYVVIKGCTITNQYYAIELNQSLPNSTENWYIVDNTIVGDRPDSCFTGDYCIGGEGVELHHTNGHVVAYNDISRTADGISYPGQNVEIYGNDIHDVSDDCVELDDGYANIAVWGNRLANCFHFAFSFQERQEMPWYIFRNQVVNYSQAIIKHIANADNHRFVMLHNTIVNADNTIGPNYGNIYDQRSEEFCNAYSRNNLWIVADGGEYRSGDTANDASIWDYESGENWRTDHDYDGFDYDNSQVTPFRENGNNRTTLSAFQSATGQETNGITINADTCFATFNVPYGAGLNSVPSQYMTLNSGCNAVNAGVVINNINTQTNPIDSPYFYDDYNSTAPDMGAYEYGASNPQYGRTSSNLSDNTWTRLPVNSDGENAPEVYRRPGRNGDMDNQAAFGTIVYRPASNSLVFYGNYYGEEIPEDIYQDTMSLWDADTNIIRELLSVYGDDSSAPYPRHTYETFVYVDSEDAIYMMNGAYSGCFNGNLWKFTFSDNTWHLVSESGDSRTVGSSAACEGHLLYYKPSNKIIFIPGYYGEGVFEFDISTNTWTDVTSSANFSAWPNGFITYESHSTWDTKRGLWVFATGRNQSFGLFAYNPATRTASILSQGGPSGSGIKETGVAYIPKYDVYLIAGGLNNSTAWIYHASTNNWEQIAAPSNCFSNSQAHIEYVPTTDTVYGFNSYQNFCTFHYVGHSTDSTPPSAPGNLSATASSESRIDITWQASTDPESGVSLYKIYRDGTVIGQAISTSFSDTGLTENTLHTYEVSAINGIGLESKLSLPASATTLADITPPTVIDTSATGDPTLVRVVFSETVEETSATSISNYSIDQGIKISGASLDADLKAVTLTTSNHTEGITYTLSVSNIEDRAKTPNVIVPNTQVTYTFTPQLVISNLTVANGKNYEVVENGLQIGALTYIDRSYTYNAIPGSFVGATYIKTANDDKSASGDSFLSFSVDQDVTVYVGYDDRISNKPSWLASFSDTGMDLVNTDTTLSLFAKDFSQGTIITLGGNEAGQSMYTIVIAGQGTSPPVNTPPSAPSNLRIIETN